MHYYIDGYNLLFRMSKAGGDLQNQRKQLIDDLFEKVHFLEMDVTLVFDSQYQLDDLSRSHKRNLEIVFTNHGETADACIIALLKMEMDPQQHTVVTSDKLLAWKARCQRAKTETVEQFIKYLKRRYENRKKHQKEPHQPLEVQITQKIKTLTPPKESPKDKPEESFDYYFYHFEKMLIEEIGEKELKKIEDARKIKKTALHEFPKDDESHKVKSDEETDFERWERLFRKMLKDKEKF